MGTFDLHRSIFDKIESITKTLSHPPKNCLAFQKVIIYYYNIIYKKVNSFSKKNSIFLNNFDFFAFLRQNVISFSTNQLTK